MHAGIYEHDVRPRTTRGAAGILAKQTAQFPLEVRVLKRVNAFIITLDQMVACSDRTKC